MANALRNHPGLHKGKLDILDAGCGTGLVGERVRDLAGKLDGIDMSSPMLEKAIAKNIYDQTYAVDLVSFMNSHPNSYDAITCAATLNSLWRPDSRFCGGRRYAAG
ncbi:MAG: methyltransferase domain-containing protein [Nitrosomonadales bacterium]